MFHGVKKWLVYGGPYHIMPLFKKDQYERILWLRLIVYHHYLHMWYRWYTGIIGSLFLVP
jgi:hypothetical protein